MSESSLYKSYAKYYDKIYSNKDYESEMAFVKWAIKKHKTSKGNELLDVACGTGNNTKFLVDDFTATGLDISSDMLKIANPKVPKAKFIKGDMKTMALKERFDVIICMFASIAYNLNYDELESTMKIFYKHLKKGGIVFFDLHIHEDYFLGDRTWVNTYVDDDLKIARIAQSPQKKDILDLNMILMIKDHGKIDFDIDHHQIALFDVAKVKKVLKNVGFEVTVYAGFEPKLWSKKTETPAMFVGVK
jgi:ubiquinone/menaquinone biosynthesis C-methylase UbiE